MLKIVMPPPKAEYESWKESTAPVEVSVVRAFNPEQDAGKLAVATRQQQRPARLCLEGSSGGERLLGVAKFIAYGFEVGAMDEPDRDRLVFAGVRKDGMHSYSAASRIEGLGK